MDNIVNNKHDATIYECSSYKREIHGLELLYEAFQKAKIGSDWKPQVQRFEMNLLTELKKLSDELKNRTFEFSAPNEFVLTERGKTRVISGDHIRDRVVKKVLCDHFLLPKIQRFLIHDNGASLKGKGVSFTRDRLIAHLRRYYLKNETNDGYILLADYSKYFDNIHHDLFLTMIENVNVDGDAIWLIEKMLKKSQVDVSYMSEEDFRNSLDNIFDSLIHEELREDAPKGEKFLKKRMNIGDQVAQIAGIYYLHRVDNYIKIVRGEKFYGRYMDDFYIIHEDRDHLERMKRELEEYSLKNGAHLGAHKVHIYKLSELWRFLKIQYSPTSTGKIIRKIHPKNITKMRRRMKTLVDVLDEDEFVDNYRSWFGGYYTYMSKMQRENMENLFDELKKRYVYQIKLSNGHTIENLRRKRNTLTFTSEEYTREDIISGVMKKVEIIGEDGVEEYRDVKIKSERNSRFEKSIIWELTIMQNSDRNEEK